MIAPPDLPEPTVLISPRALRHQVVKHLAKQIFSGGLPTGSRLVVQKLSTRFGISSTPLREALVELEATGLVEFSHNRGAAVAPFGPNQLREIYQLRRILETEAAGAACGRIERGALERLRAEIQNQADQPSRSAKWSAAVMDTDLRLHALIAGHCASQRLAREIARYNTLVQTIREIVGNRDSAQDSAVRDHLSILDALLAGDAPRAAAEMARHISSSADYVVSIMFSENL